MKHTNHSLLQKPAMLQTAVWSRTFAGVNSIPGVTGSIGGGSGD